MKYISKKFQSYMTNKDKKDYKNLKKSRLEYKKEANKIINNKETDKKSFNSNLTYISRKMSKIDNLISDIEFKAFECAEENLCKEGNIICHDRARGIKFIVGEKKNRDHYTCYDVYSMSKIKDIHWKSLVKFYSIDKISES